MIKFSLVLMCSAVVLAACQTVSLGNIASPARAPAANSANATAPEGYARLLNTTPYGFRYSVDGEPVRRGLVSERFELRSDECSGSDCGNPRYRSEIRMEKGTNRAKLGKDNWYGWSFYNANVSSYPRDVALKTVFGQWKVDGDVPPAIRILQIGRGEGDWANCDPRVCTPSSDGSKDVVLQLDDMQQAMGWGAAQNEGYICRLFSMDAAKGKWTDIVINTNFSNSSDGYLRAWVNGELACDYKGRVMATTDRASRVRPNHRRGIFVSYTERWDNVQKSRPKPTMVVYYDEFLSGNSREEVDTRMRAAMGVGAKD